MIVRASLMSIESFWRHFCTNLKPIVMWNCSTLTLGHDPVQKVTIV